jgi:hypothetical protein
LTSTTNPALQSLTIRVNILRIRMPEEEWRTFMPEENKILYLLFNAAIFNDDLLEIAREFDEDE